MDDVDVLDVPACTTTWRRPSKTIGALSGALAVIGFAFVHDLLIVDIWYSIGRMAIAGAVSGLCIAWSYNKAVATHSTRRWFEYNLICAAILIGLGPISFVVLEPRFTTAELLVADDVLAELIPPASPLMIAAAAIGTVAVWALFGQRPQAIIPILVTQMLLVFLVGHNLAILGLVEMSGLSSIAWMSVGLTMFLAAAYAAGVRLLASERVRVIASS